MSPSPARRKSIAVAQQVNKSRPIHKRRPHSITPGDSVLKQLSPASRARRSLGPRKSILKSRPSLAPDDADDVTQTMDFTRDIRGSINDNATRKSLGRRVSFASHAQVRVFEKDLKRGDTSPSAVTDNSGPSAQPGTVVNDENDYPGASMARRRSSLRRSVAFSENGEASMEMDSDLGSSPLPPSFLVQGSFLQDEEPDDVSGVWDDDADMELTTNLASNRPRKSSLGLSSLPQPGEEMGVDDHSHSEDMTQDSTGNLSTEQAEPTEFTVPLNRSLRKSEPPSAEWLALRAMTHAGGDGPYEPPPSDADEDEPSTHENRTSMCEEDMDLTEAETRLARMRESLGLSNIAQEDSFTSSEGSSIGGDDNQTVNLTNVWRESLGSDSSSVMDVTNIQVTPSERRAEETVNRVLPPALAQDQRAISEQDGSSGQPVPSVSSTLPASVTDAIHDPPAPPVPAIFTKPGTVFSKPRHAPPSPSKPKSPASPRKIGTAAFALPVARPQPNKRPASPGADDESSPYLAGEQSPAKRQALQRSPSKTASTTALTETEGLATSSAAARRSSVGGLRRPSGYFAQRKSLGPSGVLNIPQTTSPQKKGARGRASEASISGIDQSTVNFGRENVEPLPSLPHPQPPADDPSKGIDVSDPNDILPIPPPLIVVHDPVPTVELQAPTTRPTVTFADVDVAEQWRNNVQPPSLTEEDEGPPISIEQFFNMTGIRFLDEISAPRRSTILPSHLQSSQRRSSLQTTETTLADYVIAMAIDAPQLELYSHVAADLQKWIEHSKEIYRQAEGEAGKVTPMLFREYSVADEQTQAELLQQLMLIKANNHATARSQWYDWRLQWVEQLYTISDQGFRELEQDASTLETLVQQAESLLPMLREEHAEVMKELEQEQSIAADIENCDQGYLNELKATLAEQGAALDEFRAEVAEANPKLERLEEKLRDIEAEKTDMMASIEASRRTLHIQKNSTQAEAFRLKDELTSLEQLHLWHTAKIHGDLFEFIYASRFHVHIPCTKFKPLKDQIRISKTKEMVLRWKDQFPRFTEMTIKVAQWRLASSPSNLGIKQIVHRLSDFWSGSAQLRSHFTFLSIKYPVSVDPQPPRGNGDPQGLVATATVLLPSVKAKLFVSFILDSDTLWAWPASIGNVDCEIKMAYGPDIDIDKIRNAVLQRMSKCTPDDNHACFLDSCIEATLEYEVIG